MMIISIWQLVGETDDYHISGDPTGIHDAVRQLQSGASPPFEIRLSPAVGLLAMGKTNVHIRGEVSRSFETPKIEVVKKSNKDQGYFCLKDEFPKLTLSMAANRFHAFVNAVAGMEHGDGDFQMCGMWFWGVDLRAQESAQQ